MTILEAYLGIGQLALLSLTYQLLSTCPTLQKRKELSIKFSHYAYKHVQASSDLNLEWMKHWAFAFHPSVADDRVAILVNVGPGIYGILEAFQKVTGLDVRNSLPLGLDQVLESQGITCHAAAMWARFRNLRDCHLLSSFVGNLLVISVVFFSILSLIQRAND